MTKIELLTLVKNHAVKYSANAGSSINRNRHMTAMGGNFALCQNQIDAILTDFVNFIGTEYGVDYAMYASDLAAERDNLTSKV